MDLESLIRELPPEHRQLAHRDDVARRRVHEYEEELGASKPLRSPDATNELSWVSETLAVSDLSAGFPDDGELIGGDAVAAEGMEALAWYAPFHYEPKRWGIYLPDRGIWTLAKALHDPKYGPTDLLACVRASVDALLAHEYVHFLTELMATILGTTQASIQKQGLYLPYRDAVRRAAPQAGRPVEEALANAFAIEQSDARSGLMRFVAGQPDGYRDWSDFFGEFFDEGIRALLCHLLNPDLLEVKRGCVTRRPSETLFGLARELGPPSSVPVYPVRTMASTAHALIFITSISQSQLSRAKKFENDVLRAPASVRPLLDKALAQLEQDTTLNGLQFKPLKHCGEIWSIRVGRNHRAALERSGDQWTLLRLLPRGKIYDAVCR